MRSSVVHYDKELYRLVSSLSLLARWYICYQTIERMPIFANTGVGLLFGQVISIYFIFWAISYTAVGKISGWLRAESPTVKSTLYFFVYLVPLSIYWLTLLVLTHIFHILPMQ